MPRTDESVTGVGSPLGYHRITGRLVASPIPALGIYVNVIGQDTPLAGSALLTAFVGIYEHFLKLDWAGDPSRESEDGRKVPEVQAAGEELARFNQGSAPRLDGSSFWIRKRTV